MKKISIFIPVAAFICAAIVLLLCAAHGSAGLGASAADAPDDKRTKLPVVTVSGEAEYTADADGAVINGYVTSVADSPSEAADKCEEIASRAAEAFAPFGNASELNRSTCGGHGECRVYINMRFVFTDISAVNDAMRALTSAGVNTGSCEYTLSTDDGRTEALSLAIDNACKAAGELGGGRPVRVKENHCYADGFSAPGKVIYRASVNVTFVSTPEKHEQDDRPEGSGPQQTADSTEYESGGNVYIIGSTLVK